jgi:gamma-glutamylcyclotransferase (GGCT)/AIG2-like uncharacterized protein YtfP
MGAPLFVYGTLQHSAVMEAVTGLRPESVAAHVEGLARFTVRGEVYPAVVESPGARTDGLLYLDLESPTFDVLDRFEGRSYQRRLVEAITAAGERVGAQVYVARLEQRPALSDRPWDLDEFSRRHLHAFLGGYGGFGRARSS